MVLVNSFLATGMQMSWWRNPEKYCCIPHVSYQERIGDKQVLLLSFHYYIGPTATRELLKFVTMVIILLTCCAVNSCLFAHVTPSLIMTVVTVGSMSLVSFIQRYRLLFFSYKLNSDSTLWSEISSKGMRQFLKLLVCFHLFTYFAWDWIPPYSSLLISAFWKRFKASELSCSVRRYKDIINQAVW